MLHGETPAPGSENEVEELPQNFKNWLGNNAERIGKAKQLPYFLRDNVVPKSRFTQAPAVVLKLVNMDAETFIEAIEYLKRNKIKLGDMKVYNFYGKECDVSHEELNTGKYRKKKVIIYLLAIIFSKNVSSFSPFIYLPILYGILD